MAVLFAANLTIAQSSLKEDKLDISLAVVDWVESSINLEIRNHGDLGFFDLNKLTEKGNKTLTLFRTYRTSINSGFTFIEVGDSIKALKMLKGEVKFSGSDMDQTQDTLIIAVYYSKTKDASIIENLNNDLIAENAVVVKISEPSEQFEHFEINLTKCHSEKERKYLIIQFLIKSGGDDNFYYGISNAVIENLYLTKH